MGGHADVGQRRGGRTDGTENGGGRADRRMRADGARTGRIGGRAGLAVGRTSRGFKRPCTSFPASLSSAQTTRLTGRASLQGAWECTGVLAGVMSFFFLL